MNWKLFWQLSGMCCLNDWSMTEKQAMIMVDGRKKEEICWINWPVIQG